ncbi:hypothetical protein [Streptomyces fumanus]|uniref:hypothetical protein n=1 Tax=Streptomyces fumanus TaxID=67302 RepID=UPI0033DD7D3A
MTLPEFHSTDRIADPRCGSKPSSIDPACGAPATWHVAWKLTPGDAHFSLLCDLHLIKAQANFVYADRHPATITCDMPGTGWLVADPSRCVLATTDDATAQAERRRS